uniref:Amino acid transporter transmembrane domain-containing protein n=1 Tax=Auxenochlorella protothecoides TaxID=3075 RepID=A0A1D2AEW4_AUXPR
MTKNSIELDAHPNGIPNEKTGTRTTAAIHIFCGVVGAGVLALPRSVAYLGWIAGPLMIIVFYLISLLTSMLLADIYEVNGVEHGRYHSAVKSIMGHYSAVGVSTFQCLNMVLTCITYTISAATSMKAVAEIACAWRGSTQCFDTIWQMVLIFGALQLFLSQVPSLESAWWVSAMGVFTAIFYSCIALSLGLKYSGARLGSVGGIVTDPADKAFGVLGSLGAIAFAYSFAVILLEIQDTLRQPPKAVKTMKPASIISISASFAFYFTVAVANYSAFGNDVPGFIFDAYPGPKWLVLIGFICILLHMVSAFQVYSQPMFDTIESHIKAWSLRRRRTLHDAEDAPPAGEAAQAAQAKPAQGGPSPGEDGGAAGPGAGAPAGPPTALRRVSAAAGERLHRISASTGERLHRLSATASMYRVSTGFANQEVPSNADHDYLPLWQRIAIRSAYVFFTTLVACIMPFFSDMAGLVGAITFFPLSVFYPIRCWRIVFKPQGAFNHMLYAIEISMVLVSAAATIASARNIINNWSTCEAQARVMGGGMGRQGGSHLCALHLAAAARLFMASCRPQALHCRPAT